MVLLKLLNNFFSMTLQHSFNNVILTMLRDVNTFRNIEVMNDPLQ